MDKNIKLPRTGQAQGRGERVKSFEGWTGAKEKAPGQDILDESIQEVVSDTFTPIREGVDNKVDSWVGHIRRLNERGPTICYIDSPDKAFHDEIMSKLTEEEKKNVHFNWFGVPKPTSSVVVNEDGTRDDEELDNDGTIR